jgi:electron transfer flavoprotein beta subunit
LGAGSGLLPYTLAHALGRPIVANVLEARVEKGAANSIDAIIRQFLPKGQRRRVACPLPVVLAVHPLASVELKYAHSRRLSGGVEAISKTRTAEGVRQPSWSVDPASRRPVRLRVQDKKAGRARMLSAIATEAKGGVVAFEGTSVDKAQVILNYLRQHRLIDF